MVPVFRLLLRKPFGIEDEGEDADRAVEREEGCFRIYAISLSYTSSDYPNQLSHKQLEKKSSVAALAFLILSDPFPNQTMYHHSFKKTRSTLT